jgi:hypothetical protein
MLGKQLEKADVNLVGGFSGTSWGQKVNFGANAGLQFVAQGLQVPTKIGEGLGNMLTAGGREFWTGEERTGIWLWHSRGRFPARRRVL